MVLWALQPETICTAISGETNPTYTPILEIPGTYYVVCKSTYGAPCMPTITSSEVLINVTSNTIITSAISGSPYCSGATVSVPFTYSPAGNFPSGGSCTFTAGLSGYFRLFCFSDSDWNSCFYCEWK